MKISIKRIKAKDNRWEKAASIPANLKEVFEASVHNKVIPEGVYVPISFSNLRDIYMYFQLAELSDLINSNEKYDRYLVTYYS